MRGYLIIVLISVLACAAVSYAEAWSVQSRPPSQMGLNSASNGKVPHSIRKHRTDVTTISDCAHLQMMSVSGNYQLGADFSCAGTNFVPIGSIDNPFVGTLDGRGFVIDGLRITSAPSCNPNNGSWCAGLFGTLGGTVTNLRLTNVNINIVISGTKELGNQFYVGAIAGYLSGGIISNSRVSGSVSLQIPSTNGNADAAVGGLVGGGEYTGQVLMSDSSAAVSLADTTPGYAGDVFVGGLAGAVGTIQNSREVGSVTATSNGPEVFVGGLVGSAETIIQSCAYGQVSLNAQMQKGTAPGSAAGGLVGLANGNISQSCALGPVQAGTYASVGGLVGFLDSPLTIQQSFAAGAVTGDATSVAGGLVGEFEACFPQCASPTLDQSYSVGLVSGGTIGGLVGQDAYAGNVTSSYWDTQTSGTMQSAGGTPDTTDQLKCEPGSLQNCDTNTGLPTGFNPTTWEPMVTKAVQPATGAYYPALWSLQFPISIFPLAGSTPYTAPVATVFDHSPETGPNSGIAALYSDTFPKGATCGKTKSCCDDIVMAYDGQTGTSASGYRNSPTCELAGYGQAGNAQFVFSDLNYVGCGTKNNACGGPYDLNYEGHPGFDYPTAIGTYVLAAVSGTVFYPLRAIGTGGSYATYCVWHYMGEIPDAAPTYRIYYLHLSTHPAVKGEGVCAGVPGISGMQNVAFTPPQGCAYTINGTPIQSYQFPLPQGTHVTAGCPAAESGWSGLKQKSDAHLHFEIQEIVPLAEYVTAPPSIQYFPCWNENNYNSKNPNSYCLPMDPYGWTGADTNCPQGQGDIWFCLSGIPARRFWVQ